MTRPPHHHLNEVLAAAMERVSELEVELVHVLQQILQDTGDRAASNFEKYATDFLTAHAGVRTVRPRAGRPATAGTPLGAILRGSDALSAATPGLTSFSTMICVRPSEEEAAALAVEGGDPPETLHVTLAYLGDIEGDLAPVIDALAPVAASHGPLTGTVAGSGTFGADPAPSILLPDVPGLVELRVEVTEALVGAGIDYSRLHGFEAHVTLEYVTPGEGLYRPDLYGLPLTFDHLYVVRGDVVEAAIPLVGPVPLTAAGWKAPGGDELIDVDKLVATLRTKTDPVRVAAIENVAKTSLEGIGLSYDVTHPLIGNLLAQSGSQITHIANSTQLNVMRIIGKAEQEGLTIPDTAKAIQAGMKSASSSRALLIARTEMVGAVNGASVAAATIASEELGISYQKEWLTAEGAVHPRHEEYDGLNGQTVPLADMFDVGGTQLEYPGDPGGPPEEVCNCFPAETLVVAPGTEMGFRRAYDGDLVTLETDRHHVLSCTPNHPVLTDAGWKRAGLVEEGDHLVCSPFGEDERSVHPYVDDVPTSIEDVFGALARDGEPGRIRGCAVQFHGDGAANSEVDVVAAHSYLRDRLDTEISYKPSKHHLSRAGEPETLLSPTRLSFDLRVTDRSVSPGGVSGGGQTGLLLDARPSHPDVHRSGASSTLYPHLIESPNYDGSADAVEVAESFYGGTVGVSLAKVVKVERAAFHGDVFNLQTSSGVYEASGIISHNCRCTVVYIEGEPKSNPVDAPTGGGEGGVGLALPDVAQTYTASEMESLENWANTGASTPEVVAGVLSAADKTIVTKARIVHRGVQTGEKPYVGQVIKAEYDGKPYPLATSRSRGVAIDYGGGNGGVIYDIRVPADSRGLDLGTVTNDKGLDEVLLGRGHMKVTEVVWDDEAKTWAAKADWVPSIQRTVVKETSSNVVAEKMTNTLDKVATETWVKQGSAINMELRGDVETAKEMGLPKDSKKLVSQLDAAMQGTKSDQTLWRGTSAWREAIGLTPSQSIEDAVGKSFIDPAFTSLSADRDAAWAFSDNTVIFKVDVPAGTPALDLSAANEQKEILLARGTSFKVTKVEQDGAQTVFHVRAGSETTPKVSRKAAAKTSNTAVVRDLGESGDAYVASLQEELYSTNNVISYMNRKVKAGTATDADKGRLEALRKRKEDIRSLIASPDPKSELARVRNQLNYMKRRVREGNETHETTHRIKILEARAEKLSALTKGSGLKIQKEAKTAASKVVVEEKSATQKLIEGAQARVDAEKVVPKNINYNSASDLQYLLKDKRRNQAIEIPPHEATQGGGYTYQAGRSLVWKGEDEIVFKWEVGPAEINDTVLQNMQTIGNGYVRDAPASMRAHLQQVSLYQSSNPADAYWAKKYKMPGFTSAATGGGGEINFWHARRTFFNQSTFDHEMGHVVGDWGGPRDLIEWRRIQGTDKVASAKIEGGVQVQSLRPILTGERAVSTYGSMNNNEDWAESVRLFLQDRREGSIGTRSSNGVRTEVRFADVFPGRARILAREFPE